MGLDYSTARCREFQVPFQLKIVWKFLFQEVFIGTVLHYKMKFQWCFILNKLWYFLLVNVKHSSLANVMLLELV